jgi:poly-beta-1,6-N-acetyl-D-glucosamine synthase
VTGAVILFWASALTLGWVYAGYPLVALFVGRLHPFRLRPTDPPPAFVTIGVPARDEATRLPGRIRDILDQEVGFGIEVIVGSDGSTDETASVVASIGRDDPRVRVLDLPENGTAATHRAIFESARGAIVVLTDAETRYAPGCLAALVAPFADPRVGCTTGRLAWVYDRATGTARQEGAYWRYELAVRDVESRAGWLTAATGALLAVRRDCFRPAPPHLSVDQLLPLLVRDQGMTVLAVPEARAVDRGSSDESDQFNSRARIATRGIQTTLYMASRLTPWRRPGAFLAVWSHKLLRWATPWLSVAALGSAGSLAVAGQVAFALPAVGGVAILLVGTIGYAARRRGVRIPFTSFPVAVCVVNAAFAVAWLNLLRRRRIPSWRRVEDRAA